MISIKIVASTKAPESKYYGFIKMERHEDASKCISYLNNTDMDGDTITVEWVNIRPFLWSILHFRGAYLVLLAYHFGITC